MHLQWQIDATGLDERTRHCSCHALALAIAMPRTKSVWQCFSTAASITFGGCRIAEDLTTNCPNAAGFSGRHVERDFLVGVGGEKRLSIRQPVNKTNVQPRLQTPSWRVFKSESVHGAVQITHGRLQLGSEKPPVFPAHSACRLGCRAAVGVYPAHPRIRMRRR